MKFSEFKYEHLDETYLKENYEKGIKKLKEANNANDFMAAFNELNEFRGHMSSMSTLCSIRHTINTADEFYDAWIEFNQRISRIICRILRPDFN